MRILLHTHAYPPYEVAGTAMYTRALAEHLATTAEIAVSYPLPDTTVPNIAVHRHADSTLTQYQIIGNFTNLRRLFYGSHKVEAQAYVEAFLAAIVEFKPDVIHFQHLIDSPALDLVCAASTIPTVLTLHDHWLICPSIHYLRSDGVPCTGPMNSLWTCAACMRNVPLTPVDMMLTSLNRIGLLNVAARLIPPESEPARFLQRDRIMAEILQHIDAVVAPTQALIGRIAAPVGDLIEGKTHIIPHGHPPLPPCDREVERGGPTPTAAFIGSFTPGKGIHVLLGAAALLRDTHHEITIRLYGYAPDPAYQTEIERLAATLPNVQIMGRYDHDDLACILADVDCVVVPSIWYENSPLVIAEAFLAGRPVIASNHGGMAELTQHGTAGGALFEPGNATDLASTLVRFFNDTDLRERTLRTIPDVLTMGEHAAQLKTLYSELIRGKHRPSLS